LLDPLTQVIQRTYILGFIKDCIENRIPFTMAILDLDNFKAINDNYGHASGDGVLFDVAQSLSKYLGKDGLVGRYGGDEFIFVYLKTNNYQQIHSLYSTMFEEGHVLRKNVKLKNCSPFITGTIGSASYPEDAKDYNDLFSMSDKTLYRGKMKGRNCFIIYVKEKHEHIEVNRIKTFDLCETMKTIEHIFSVPLPLNFKFKKAALFLQDELNVTDLLYVSSNNELIAASTGNKIGKVNDLSDILDEKGFFQTYTFEDMKDKEKTLYNALRQEHETSILLTTIQYSSIVYGYVMIYINNSQRIWQSDEKAMLLYLSKLIAFDITLSDDKSLK
jgi:diguanylate cyclase (GGDEF)-like protein